MKGNRIALAMAAIAFAPAAFSQDIHATVNGTHVDFQGTDPMMMNGRVMVPMRGVFEHMGAVVDWNPASRTVLASRGNTDVKLMIGSRYGMIDGQRVELDSPPVIVAMRTMVPLRFISEALGADVEWIENTRTVAITMGGLQANTNPRGFEERYEAPAYTRTLNLEANTVLPVKLNTTLSSRTSEAGDKFTATLDTNGNAMYATLPAGTIIEGHVDVARPKNSQTPGLLGLEFDRIKFPSGQTFAIDGSLIGLDGKSVVTTNGRIEARSGSSDNLKYVGYGAGAGALLAVLTDGKVLNNALIGAALGYLYGTTQRSEYRDVTLEPGAEFGVKLNQDETFVAVRMPRP